MFLSYNETFCILVRSFNFAKDSDESILRILNFVGVKLNGTPRFISTDVKFDSFNLIEIGDNAVISDRVILLTHDYSCTNALRAIGEMHNTDVSISRHIKIGNNSFIGMGSILLPGTEIGDNVIVGAGSVVRGKIPSNSIVVGNPAKVIDTIENYAMKIKNKNYSLVADRK